MSWGEIGKALNSTIKTSDFMPLDAMIKNISKTLLFPKWTKCAIESEEVVIPKDGMYKIIACGRGGARSTGGGGCSIDQRQYFAGDVITLTVNGIASAVCVARGLTMTANAASSTNGGTAVGGNVANYKGGNSTDVATERDSLGCAAGARQNGQSGGNGGILGGEGGTNSSSSSVSSGNGGDGGYIGGKGGGSFSRYLSGRGGNGGILGGHGGDSSSSTSAGEAVAADGGDGGYIGGKGGNITTSGNSTGNPLRFAGRGGNGGILGGKGGNVASVNSNPGTGGTGGGIDGAPGSIATGGAGGFTGMYWTLPFAPEILQYVHGNPIIFLEEV